MTCCKIFGLELFDELLVLVLLFDAAASMLLLVVEPLPSPWLAPILKASGTFWSSEPADEGVEELVVPPPPLPPVVVLLLLFGLVT